MPVDAAVGVYRDGYIVAAGIFQHFNGYNVEFSYYGRDTLTPTIARVMARFALERFNPSRVTMTTAQANKRILRFLSIRIRIKN